MNPDIKFEIANQIIEIKSNVNGVLKALNKLHDKIFKELKKLVLYQKKA